MASTRIPSIDVLRALRQSTINTSRSTKCQSQLRSKTTARSIQTYTRSYIHSGSRTNTTNNTSVRAFTTSRPSKIETNKPPSTSQTSPTTGSHSASPSASPTSTTTTVPASSHTGGQNPQLSSSNRYAPTSTDRGPTSTEDTQTDFGAMDIYSNTPDPATSIDACAPDGFHLNNGTKVMNGSALLLAGAEAWAFRPWLSLPSASTSTTTISDLLNPTRGILTIPPKALGILSMLYPKPDLLIVGTGSKVWMLAKETREFLMEEMGMRIDVMDTANASAAYNLLAKERGVEGGAGVGGIFLPVGWRGPVGAGRRR